MADPRPPRPPQGLQVFLVRMRQVQGCHGDGVLRVGAGLPGVRGEGVAGGSIGSGIRVEVIVLVHQNGSVLDSSLPLQAY